MSGHKPMVNGPRLRMFLVMRVDEEANRESDDMAKEVVEVAKEDEVMTDEWGAGMDSSPRMNMHTFIIGIFNAITNININIINIVVQV